MAVGDVTFVGQVASVTGSIVRVRLRSDMPTTVLFVDGDSYRVGQIGAVLPHPAWLYASVWRVHSGRC